MGRDKQVRAVFDLAAPDISVTPSSHNFGSVNVGSSASFNFTVRNDGSAPLHVSSSSISGAAAGSFSITSGGGAATLSPGATRTLAVRFTPSSSGTKAATLRVSSDDPDEGLVDVTLQGQGAVAATCPVSGPITDLTASCGHMLYFYANSVEVAGLVTDGSVVTLLIGGISTPGFLRIIAPVTSTTRFSFSQMCMLDSFGNVTSCLPESGTGSISSTGRTLRIFAFGDTFTYSFDSASPLRQSGVENRLGSIDEILPLMKTIPLDNTTREGAEAGSLQALLASQLKAASEKR
jgi:hypothetical protein